MAYHAAKLHFCLHFFSWGKDVKIVFIFFHFFPQKINGGKLGFITQMHELFGKNETTFIFRGPQFKALHSEALLN